MKILIIEDLHPCLSEKLKASNHQCDIKLNPTANELIAEIGNYDGLIVRTFNVGMPIISAGKRLQFIARAGAGMENINVDFAEERGITCISSPEGNRDAVAEHALGMLLSLLNNLNKADKEIRKGKWDRKGNWGTTLKGKTVGIIGYGNMGSAFAERLMGFGVNVIAFDKYKVNFGNHLVKEVTLSEIFERADVVSIHVPITVETQDMVNHEFLSKFNKPIYLINTSRGEIVNTAALMEALKTSKVIGACLDVLEHEKKDFENLFEIGIHNTFKQLIDSDKVILSPHVAGWTNESYLKHSEVLFEKITALFS